MTWRLWLRTIETTSPFVRIKLRTSNPRNSTMRRVLSFVCSFLQYKDNSMYSCGYNVQPLFDKIVHEPNIIGTKF